MPSNRAFTLLELLVVITIIGILTSIVVVSMSGSTDSATIAKGKSYAQQVHALLGANAVGVWNFDEGTGTTVKDISGYGNDGAIHGDPEWTDSDIEGTILQFDGADDYVDCGNNVSLKNTGDLTLEAWIIIDSFPKNYPMVVGKSYSYDYYFGINNIGPELRFYHGDGSYEALGSIGAGITVDQWFHIVAVRTLSPKEINFYVDGIYISTASYTKTVVSSNETVKIGTRNDFYSYLSGLIDEVRIYSAALPSTEIQKHYVQGLERLLSNQSITQVEYDQRMVEFNQSLVLYEQ